MSEPVTIWERAGSIYGNRAGVIYSRQVVDHLRRAKHLTNAEIAAEYWASHGADTGGEGALHWTPLSKRLTLRRFAEHDQAV
ncbi:hypothetical protein [Arthrobacter sp. RCC_34]|uniref:hypothetical protein n=1 Tax=Arthrobacter sp. RCC_34 TaxID=3239230 RepID=UPI003523C909